MKFETKLSATRFFRGNTEFGEQFFGKLWKFEIHTRFIT